MQRVYEVEFEDGRGYVYRVVVGAVDEAAARDFVYNANYGLVDILDVTELSE